MLEEGTPKWKTLPVDLESHVLDASNHSAGPRRAGAAWTWAALVMTEREGLGM